jgi:3'-phosphoadenosine 5'-phosphosulfate (PAPS) 3'-phosphatase
VSSVLLAVYVVVGVAVAVAIVMSFFVRRHGESVTPAGDWQRTDEVFVDPTTNRRMRVWVDPVDGTRHYVEETT